jgi:uncharacterized protein
MNTLDSTRFHLYSLEGRHILIGSNGGLYALDNETYDRLSKEGEAPFPDDDAISCELREIDRLEGPRLRLSPPRERSLRALCLNITYDCNMRCIYCFTRNRQKAGTGSMDIATARGAIDYLLRHSSEKAVLQVDFFGGEPLLNFNVLKEAIGYAKKEAQRRGRQVKFTVTTNGILLDRAVGDYLNEEGFSVILSIDGPPLVNNAHRPFMDGQPSWSVIFRNIEDFLVSRDYRDYYVRGTFTPLSLDLAETARFYVSHHMSNFSLEPARGPSGEHWAVTEKELPRLMQEYEKLALFAHSCRKKSIPFNFFHFNLYMDTPLCVTRRLTGCGAGVEYLSIGTGGEIYPCHQFHDIQEFSMGNIHDERPATGFADLKERMQESHVFQKQSCLSCWAALYCSGGCHASSYFDSGDILQPDPVGCALQKKRLECALWLRACDESPVE